MAANSPLRIRWIHRECDRSLRKHVVLGDDLGVAVGGEALWFSPEAVQLSGVRTLVLRYEGHGQCFAFCLPAAEDVAARIESARETAKPAGAARKWGPLVGKFSYLTEEPQSLIEQAPLSAAPFTHARRRAHPDPLIDRFLVRDRFCGAAMVDCRLEIGENVSSAGREDLRPRERAQWRRL